MISSVAQLFEAAISCPETAKEENCPELTSSDVYHAILLKTNPLEDEH